MIVRIGKKAHVVVDQKPPRKDGDEPRIKFASAHDLRRTFGERWAERVDAQVLMELMRHEDISTTLRFYVGRNARQNEEVTFKRAAPDDLWLHVRGQPGAHVIIKTGGRTVPEDVIQRAAALAARHSPAHGENRVGVNVVERRFVRRLRGGRPGLVTYRNERTIWVSAKRNPAQEDERPKTP